jgi:hypothetical protein
VIQVILLHQAEGGNHGFVTILCPWRTETAKKLEEIDDYGKIIEPDFEIFAGLSMMRTVISSSQLPNYTCGVFKTSRQVLKNRTGESA